MLDKKLTLQNCPGKKHNQKKTRKFQREDHKLFCKSYCIDYIVKIKTEKKKSLATFLNTIFLNKVAIKRSVIIGAHE